MYISTGADPGFFAGGGGSTTAVYCGRLRRPRRRGVYRLINIRLRYIASIEYSERLFLIFLFLLVKKFVEKKMVVESRGGGHDPPPPPPPPGSAPAQMKFLFLKYGPSSKERFLATRRSIGFMNKQRQISC